MQISMLTVKRLADAITTATSDPAMRERAAALGERVRAEDGVSRAVELVDQCLDESASTFGN
jgi:sterol 3beta-glucosyltransferase